MLKYICASFFCFFLLFLSPLNAGYDWNFSPEIIEGIKIYSTYVNNHKIIISKIANTFSYKITHNNIVRKEKGFKNYSMAVANAAKNVYNLKYCKNHGSTVNANENSWKITKLKSREFFTEVYNGWKDINITIKDLDATDNWRFIIANNTSVNSYDSPDQALAFAVHEFYPAYCEGPQNYYPENKSSTEYLDTITSYSSDDESANKVNTVYQKRKFPPTKIVKNARKKPRASSVLEEKSINPPHPSPAYGDDESPEIHRNSLQEINISSTSSDEESSEIPGALHIPPTFLESKNPVVHLLEIPSSPEVIDLEFDYPRDNYISPEASSSEEIEYEEWDEDKISPELATVLRVFKTKLIP